MNIYASLEPFNRVHRSTLQELEPLTQTLATSELLLDYTVGIH